jgi:hypothetical protein
MDGFLEIKKLEKIYVESPQEVRDYILSKVIEIETETCFGQVITF